MTTFLRSGATVGPEDRDAWLAARRSGIGASEAAAVLGICPYTSPRELYARKLGLAPDVEETEAMRRGHHMESFLADEYRRRFPAFAMAEQVFARHPELPFLIATLDGFRSDGICVEFKTASWRSAAKWGPEHSDEIPDSYTCQAQHQMAVSGATTCHVFASVGGDDGRLYVVERNHQFIDLLIKKASEFWRRVEQRDPPPASRAEDAWVHHLLYPEPEGEVRLDPAGVALVEQWQREKQARAHAEKEAATLKALILDRLGPAVSGILPDGRAVTRRTVTKKAHTIQVRESTYTDLRLKEARTRDGQ